MKRPRRKRERYTTCSENSTPATLNLHTELDLLETINACRVVIDGFAQGHHADYAAVRVAGQAIARKARIAHVATVNREVAA